MKKIFAAAAIALFMMTSCSDDDSSSNNNNDAVLVKRTVETSADGTLTTNYHYNGTKLTHIEMSDDSDINFTYDGGKISKIEYKVANELVQRNAYTYDNQGRLSSMIEYIFDEGDMYADKKMFTYNADGTVSTQMFTGTHTSQTELVEEGTVTIVNGNITKYESDGDNYTYAFDNKNNPEKNIFAVDILNLGWYEGGVNNITSYTDNWGGSYTKTYTYNSDNYPVTSSEDWDGDITTTQYFYE